MPLKDLRFRCTSRGSSKTDNADRRCNTTSRRSKAERVLRGQCLHRRIGERKQLVSQIAAWEKQRNKARARIKWMLTVERARTKLARAYPDPTKES